MRDGERRVPPRWEKKTRLGKVQVRVRGQQKRRETQLCSRRWKPTPNKTAHCSRPGPHVLATASHRCSNQVFNLLNQRLCTALFQSQRALCDSNQQLNPLLTKGSRFRVSLGCCVCVWGGDNLPHTFPHVEGRGN